MKRKTKLTIGGLIVAFILGAMLVLPLFDKKSLLDVLQSRFQSNIDKNVLGDEIEDNQSAAYHYWYAPENSFGISETKTVNWSYFWSLFKKHSMWQLEAWHPILEEWVSEYNGQNLNEWLNITRVRNESNASEKITLNVTNNAPVDTWFRFTFGIDVRVKQYVNKTSNYEYELTYPANATENYTVFFNFSDVKPLIESGAVIPKHGVVDDYYYFRLTQNMSRNPLCSGCSFEIDPTFGWTGTTGANLVTIEDKIVGAYAQMGAIDGTADTITAHIDNGIASATAKAALYDSSKNLVANGVTGEITIAPDGAKDRTFTFSAPKPSLTANAWYYICVWASTAGAPSLQYYWQLGDGIFYDDETYNGFPDPFAGNTHDADGRSRCYCTYTEGGAANTAPTVSGESVWDRTTNHSYNATCVNIPIVSFNVTLIDAEGDTMDWYVRTNHSGVWQDVNISYDLSNGTYNASNTSWVDSWNTKYWITYNVTDGTDWTNQSFYFWSCNLTWQVVDNSINGTIYNTTYWNTIDNSINGSIYNTTHWHVIDNTINGSIYNITRWNTIDNTINGSIYNMTQWHTIDNTINGSIYNSTTWHVIDNNINGSIYNISNWHIIDQTINGTIYNTSVAVWYTIDSSINGSIYNLTTWHTIDDMINGSIYNITHWYVIDNTINGSIYNTTHWNTVNNSINGTIYNITTTWNTIDNTINGTIYNTSISNITISNPFPTNNSLNNRINETLHITINHISGYTMNITWYYGNSSTNCTHYLGYTNDTNNGTCYMAYPYANQTFTDYWWRVNATDGMGNYTQKTYNYQTGANLGAGVVLLGGRDRFVIGICIGILLGCIIGLVVVSYLRQKKKEEVI